MPRKEDPAQLSPLGGRRTWTCTQAGEKRRDWDALGPSLRGLGVITAGTPAPALPLCALLMAHWAQQLRPRRHLGPQRGLPHPPRTWVQVTVRTQDLRVA